MSSQEAKVKTNGYTSSEVRVLNEKDNGCYKSILTPYVDCYVCIKTQEPIKDENAKLLCRAYREAQSWVFPGENDAEDFEIMRAVELICEKESKYNQFRPRSLKFMNGGMFVREFEAEF